MFNRLLLLISAIYIITSAHSQVIIVPIGLIGASAIPEHGFLPGKKFKFYSTIHKYDFNGRHFRVELYDDRANLKLKRIECSELEFTNMSEFSNPNCINKVSQYIDTLFRQSNARVDSTAGDTLIIKFEGIDARLIGFGHTRFPSLPAAGGALCGIIFLQKLALGTKYWYFCKKLLL